MGLLGDVEDRDIELPHSDRSKTPIEPLLADQWFVAMDHWLNQRWVAVTDERVKIFPERYRKGYLDWLGEKTRLACQPSIVVGSPDSDLVATQLSASERDGLIKQLESLIGDSSNQASYRVDEADDGSFGIFVCLRDEGDKREGELEAIGFERDPDVLDTWFSSALWPHSTLGWPEQTPELEYFYPTSTLITSRDIITLWVARMVLMGLNNTGEVPFHEVFIHPKILDGLGETMSKSKGNGVDPIDVIDKFGPDALRFGLARLATDTQDVRMPVQYECPHCEKLIDQILGGDKFSLVTLFGVVALGGIVVNDSIVMISFMNNARRAGKGRWDSVVEAGATRLRPVILTSMTTIAGLLPTALGLGGSSAVWRPLANTIAWGLVFSTILTLLVIPCVLSVVDDIRLKAGLGLVREENGLEGAGEDTP